MDSPTFFILWVLCGVPAPIIWLSKTPQDQRDIGGKVVLWLLTIVMLGPIATISAIIDKP